uniref:Uncharacterized protein n=1 Tax=Arundo donax TaxID=35708 RepID=A0A0A9CQK4_ARUDO
MTMSLDVTLVAASKPGGVVSVP